MKMTDKIILEARDQPEPKREETLTKQQAAQEVLRRIQRSQLDSIVMLVLAFAGVAVNGRWVSIALLVYAAWRFTANKKEIKYLKDHYRV